MAVRAASTGRPRWRATPCTPPPIFAMPNRHTDRRDRQPGRAGPGQPRHEGTNVIPPELRYTDKHEWIAPLPVDSAGKSASSDVPADSAGKSASSDVPADSAGKSA